MKITRKIDRAFQWAGERIGGEAKTSHSDEFKMLEAEMALRHDGVDRLQKSMTSYVKWIGRRNELLDDKERGYPTALLGRSMASHGEDFEQDSEFGNCLLSFGRANERISAIQESYVETATSTWLDNLERSLAMMKEYLASRKKLENRRLAYDASVSKMSKARRDDFRIEEEVRTNKAKFEEASEDVLRRMQDIKEAEVDNIESLTGFLDAELEYHERCAEELRRVRQNWAGAAVQQQSHTPRPTLRSRSNTARSWQQPNHHSVYEEPEPEQEQVRIPHRTSPRSRLAPPPPPQPPRPGMARASTFDGRSSPMTSTPLANLRVPGAPLTRTATDNGHYGPRNDDVFADDISSTSRSATSRSGSPEWADGRTSPATSYGSLSRCTSALGKKPPPPPPVNRAKKPPPPPPSRKEHLAYY